MHFWVCRSLENFESLNNRANMAGRKRKILTLQERVKVVDRLEKGESARMIATSLAVGKTQIQAIASDKVEIKRRWQEGENGKRKYGKQRKCGYPDLDDAVWSWFCEARSRNIPMSGRLIQEKAAVLATAIGHDDFTASNGWLDRWKTRHNVRCSVLNGESADVPEGAVADWSVRLPAICDGYAAKDIFNADETGLFYRALPARSMVAKGDTCKGGKVSKDRITVLLAVSATGEKLRPLVIGHAKKPRCFCGFEVASLGVEYTFNKKAWMTSILFNGWLTRLNNKMQFEQRHIMMFVDNCSAHPDIQLSHVKLVFLPPNTTSRLQPCDAGIIQAVKMQYRKQLLRHVLRKMENDETGTASALSKSVTVLDAIMWLKVAWDALKASTHTKCFIKCGFDVPSDGRVLKHAAIDTDLFPENTI